MTDLEVFLQRLKLSGFTDLEFSTRAKVTRITLSRWRNGDQPRGDNLALASATLTEMLAERQAKLDTLQPTAKGDEIG